MNIHDHRTGSGVSAWMFDMRYRPTAMTARPAMITGLYFPVLETRIPEPTELMMRPARRASV